MSDEKSPSEKKEDNQRIQEYLNVDKSEYIDKDYKNSPGNDTMLLKNAGLYTNYLDHEDTHEVVVQ